MTTSAVFNPYRTPDRPPVPAPPSYVEHWSEYHRRMRLFIVALLGVMPVLGGIGFVADWLLKDPTPVLVPALGLYGVALVLMFERAKGMKCPRCDWLFDSDKALATAQRGKCGHCRLPRGAPCDPDWKPNDAEE